jgi:hypothetical protein
MDGDASHSSEVKLCIFMRDVLLFLCFSFPSLALYLIVMFSSILYSVLFYLDCSFPLPVGPHPPNG